MTKLSPGHTLLLLCAVLTLVQVALLGSGTPPPVYRPPTPASPISSKGNSCPTGCSAQLTATADKLQAQIDELREAMNHDIPLLDQRTIDLNNRLRHFEDQEGNGPEHKALAKALAEINDLDARVVELERPEVEDDAK